MQREKYWKLHETYRKQKWNVKIHKLDVKVAMGARWGFFRDYNLENMENRHNGRAVK